MARAGRPGASSPTLPAPAVGRHEAAGRHRARAGEPAAHPADGRAVRRARRADARQMQSYLLQIWKQVDITILFITHDLDEAVYLADRILVLDAHPGRVRELIEVPVPRPRSPEQFLDPTFIAARRHLEELIHRAPPRSRISCRWSAWPKWETTSNEPQSGPASTRCAAARRGRAVCGATSACACATSRGAPACRRCFTTRAIRSSATTWPTRSRRSSRRS